MSDKGLSGLARSLGDGNSDNAAHPLWNAMGGVLGIVETIVPGFVFIIVYAVSSDAWLSIGVSASCSVLFTLYRILRRQAITSALVGLAGVVLSAALAIFSNRPEDNFVVGLLTNAGYGAAFLISILIRWPLAGVIVSLLRSDDKKWRENRHHFRVFTGVTAMWVALFSIRLLVEWPLYQAGDVGSLAVAKLVLGLPLYVPVLALSWLIVRSLYREKPAQIS